MHIHMEIYYILYEYMCVSVLVCLLINVFECIITNI